MIAAPFAWTQKIIYVLLTQDLDLPQGRYIPESVGDL